MLYLHLLLLARSDDLTHNRQVHGSTIVSSEWGTRHIMHLLFNSEWQVMSPSAC